MAVPVHVVAGFLGAGKTSALRAQLEARRGERIAIIVNDFGEASLDAATLEVESPFRITNIPGGCVCCTAPEGFVDALGAVLETRPDRVLIEPTGLARPQDLVDTIRRCRHADALALAPLIVLLDPGELARLESGGDATTLSLLREQADGADVLVANRIDLCGDAALARFRRFATERWPAPLAVLETTEGRLPASAFEWPAGEGARAAHAHAHAHDHAAPSTADHAARSWRWAPDAVFSHARLSAALARMLRGEAGAPLARFKGIFRTEQGVSRLEIAGGALHDRLTAFRRDSRADAIVGKEHEVFLANVFTLLNGALLSEKEARLDPNLIEIVLPGVVHAVDRALLESLPDGIPDVGAHFPKRAGAGARVRALFERLGVGTQGSAVVVAGDGFASEPVPLSVLREGVLVHSLDGAPLPEKQGGPFRLLIPESASPEPVSCANVKGVAKIALR
ncbi:MAG TPA: GTP-binding protein [Myxococcota bacterium]|nr:GTP-binding protein [Myxococcota bacterium]